MTKEPEVTLFVTGIWVPNLRADLVQLLPADTRISDAEIRGHFRAEMRRRPDDNYRRDRLSLFPRLAERPVIHHMSVRTYGGRLDDAIGRVVTDSLKTLETITESDLQMHTALHGGAPEGGVQSMLVYGVACLWGRWDLQDAAVAPRNYWPTPSVNLTVSNVDRREHLTVPVLCLDKSHRENTDSLLADLSELGCRIRGFPDAVDGGMLRHPGDVVCWVTPRGVVRQS
jgi:hypothetical protein